jgi:hypothetical protein
MLGGAVGTARAADFYAIIANLTAAKKPQAQLDVSANIDAAPEGTDFVFTVFNAAGQQASQFSVQTNANGFVSSASAAPPNNNLFALSAGLPALVRVHTPSTATTSAAMLRETLKSSTIELEVPEASLGVGRVFSATLGDIRYRATLLIGNVSGTDVNVDVFLGTAGCGGCGKYNLRVGDQQIGSVELDPDTDAHSHVIVVSSSDIVVQLALDDGKKNTTTEVALFPIQ